MAWIACLGECMIELREVAEAQGGTPATGLMRRGFGGDTLNTAIYAARRGGGHASGALPRRAPPGPLYDPGR